MIASLLLLTIQTSGTSTKPVATDMLIENIPIDSWVYITVSVTVLLWVIGIAVVFYKLLRKYTFGKWTKANPNPYETETFGMPRGTFRGILTLSLLFIVMLLEVVNLAMTGLETKIDQLLVAFQMMLAFYFGSKVMHHVTSADRTKTIAEVTGENPADKTQAETEAVG